MLGGEVVVAVVMVGAGMIVLVGAGMVKAEVEVAVA